MKSLEIERSLFVELFHLLNTRTRIVLTLLKDQLLSAAARRVPFGNECLSPSDSLHLREAAISHTICISHVIGTIRLSYYFAVFSISQSSTILFDSHKHFCWVIIQSYQDNPLKYK